MKEIGSIIKERRLMLGINQQTLSELAGVGINTLVSIERGSGNPSIQVLTRVLDVLGLQITIGLKQ